MGICIGVIIFSLCVSFVNATGAFPIGYTNEITVGDSTNETVNSITNNWNIDSVFTALSVLSLGGLAFIIYLTQSLNVVGAYLFFVIFWGSYSRAVLLLSGAGFITGSLVLFVGIFTAIIALVFIGAIIGMFTGSG